MEEEERRKYEEGSPISTSTCIPRVDLEEGRLKFVKVSQGFLQGRSWRIVLANLQ